MIRSNDREPQSPERRRQKTASVCLSALLEGEAAAVLCAFPSMSSSAMRRTEWRMTE